VFDGYIDENYDISEDDMEMNKQSASALMRLCAWIFQLHETSYPPPKRVLALPYLHRTLQNLSFHLATQRTFQLNNQFLTEKIVDRMVGETLQATTFSPITCCFLEFSNGSNEPGMK